MVVGAEFDAGAILPGRGRRDGKLAGGGETGEFDRTRRRDRARKTEGFDAGRKIESPRRRPDGVDAGPGAAALRCLAITIKVELRTGLSEALQLRLAIDETGIGRDSPAAIADRVVDLGRRPAFADDLARRRHVAETRHGDSGIA